MKHTGYFLAGPEPDSIAWGYIADAAVPPISRRLRALAPDRGAPLAGSILRMLRDSR